MGTFDRARILGGGHHNFNVLKEFSGLDSVRKMALFDRLSDSRKSFYKTVTLFWPQAQVSDSKQLERYIVQSIAANDI